MCALKRPPVVQRLEPIVLESGSRLQGELNYYEYGVVSIKLELPFEVDWPQLVDLSSRWIDAPELEARAVSTVRDCLKGVQAALVNPHEPWLDEDYYIIHLKNTGAQAAELIDRHGKGKSPRSCAGNWLELSPGETSEILDSRMSYYPEDLLVVGWIAAFIHDTAGGRRIDHSVAGIRQHSSCWSFVITIRFLSTLLEGVYNRWRKSRCVRALRFGVAGPEPEQDSFGYSRADRNAWIRPSNS